MPAPDQQTDPLQSAIDLLIAELQRQIQLRDEYRLRGESMQAQAANELVYAYTTAAAFLRERLNCARKTL